MKPVCIFRRKDCKNPQILLFSHLDIKLSEMDKNLIKRHESIIPQICF